MVGSRLRRNTLLPLLLGALACRPTLPGATRLTPGEGSEQNPCLSPDGETLVFTRFLDGYNGGPSEVVAMRIRSGRETRLVRAGDHDHVNMPGRCISADGARLAYSGDDEDRDEIWVLDLETAEAVRLTDHPPNGSTEPGFAGADLVFQADGRIWWTAADGSSERALTPEGSDDRQPSPHPDGDRVVFQSTRGGTWGIWEVPIEGGTPAAVVDGDAEETDVSWAADGSTLVWATDACDGLSCIERQDEGLVGEEPGWYLGAPTVGPGDETLFEASPGDPDEVGATAIWRLD